MEQIAGLERRITAALDRLSRGIDALGWAGPASADAGDAGFLAARLEEEQQANAQLAERLRAVREREAEARLAIQDQTEHLTRRLDEQGIEVQRLHRVVVQLREQLRIHREAAAGQVADPQQINRAMLAELEALRATRAAEVAEMDGILAELAPLVAEAEAVRGGRADA
ncbi:MAG: hypothetical protein QM656_01985 [Paracoccaceae bacterium]